MARIFLSYDHEDVGLAKPIAEALEKNGHTVWYDRHIQGGAQYSHKIEQALDAADTVVVLWSEHSLSSAWVRDEAAEGRDRGKLVPLKVGGVTVPIGFRQFQTIDLGAWKGRGKVPNFDRLLDAVGSHNDDVQSVGPIAPASVPSTAAQPRSPRTRITAAIATLVLLATAFGAWKWSDAKSLPIIEVSAADKVPRSLAAASDLFVKLGSLAQIGEGKWQLVDAASAPRQVDLEFRTADTGAPGAPHANLVLLDGKDNALLWSRDFEVNGGSDADLRLQLSLTAGRLLGCALEAREAGGLRRDLLKLFYDVCANLEENSFDEPGKVLDPLRTIIAAQRQFAPAWSRLIWADMGVVDSASNGGRDIQATIATLKRDVAAATKAAPGLPELKLAEIKLLPAEAYATKLRLSAEAAAIAPNSPEIFGDQAGNLQSVGRMDDGVDAARRAAQLDPLSPTATTQLILAQAYAGRLDAAHADLAKAEKMWAGTGALRDALWAYHLRFGDPVIATKYAPDAGDEGFRSLLAARRDPSSVNVEKLVSLIHSYEGHPWAFGGATQALAEFNRIDDVFRWVDATSPDVLAGNSYLFFRPAFAGVRKDPRFMVMAKRIGLIAYWRSSGHWPDFCEAPGLPYDCKTEAAKNAA